MFVYGLYLHGIGALDALTILEFYNNFCVFIYLWPVDAGCRLHMPYLAAVSTCRVLTCLANIRQEAESGNRGILDQQNQQIVHTSINILQMISHQTLRNSGKE